MKWILNMLRKLIGHNLDLYYVCCYIYICTVLFVSVIIVCYGIIADKILYLSIQGRLPFYKEYFMEATVYEGQSRICIEVLRPSKQLSSCRDTSHPLTLLLGRIRHTKRLTSTLTKFYHWVITAESTMFQSFQAVSKELGIRKGR